MSVVWRDGRVRVVRTPWADLSATGRLRRLFAWTMGLGVVGMVASASTANTDWNVTQEDVERKFGHATA